MEKNIENNKQNEIEQLNPNELIETEQVSQVVETPLQQIDEGYKAMVQVENTQLGLKIILASNRFDTDILCTQALWIKNNLFKNTKTNGGSYIG